MHSVFLFKKNCLKFAAPPLHYYDETFFYSLSGDADMCIRILPTQS